MLKVCSIILVLYSSTNIRESDLKDNICSLKTSLLEMFLTDKSFVSGIFLCLLLFPSVFSHSDAGCSLHRSSSNCFFAGSILSLFCCLLWGLFLWSGFTWFWTSVILGTLLFYFMSWLSCPVPHWLCWFSPFPLV